MSEKREESKQDLSELSEATDGILCEMVGNSYFAWPREGPGRRVYHGKGRPAVVEKDAKGNILRVVRPADAPDRLRLPRELAERLARPPGGMPGILRIVEEGQAADLSETERLQKLVLQLQAEVARVGGGIVGGEQ